MRIGIASYFYPRGGSAYAIRSIVDGLVRRGVTVQLVTGSLGGAAEGQNASKFYGELLTREHDYSQAYSEWEQGLDPMAGPMPMHGSYEQKVGVPDRDFSEISPDLARLQIEAWMKTLSSLEGPCDLLHLHHLTPLTIAARELWPDIPIVTTLHGTELKWLAREGPESRNSRYWSALMRRAASMSDVLIALNEEDKSAARRMLDTREADRIEVIRGGVNIDQFRPMDRVLKTGGLGSATHFVCVARFIEAKRIPTLMRAWTIAEQDLHINARLTVIGGTSSEVEGEDPILLARRLGLRNVAFIPPTSQAELAVLLRRADVFVLPSVNESFGQVFFEALASGIPVVACQSGAPGELLASQCPPVGWFCEPDHASALASRLLQAATDPSEQQKRGAAGRELAVDVYSWDKVVERLMLLYEELLQPHPVTDSGGEA